MIIVFPHPPGRGGPGSFQTRFEKELINNGWKIRYSNEKGPNPDLIFVVGGTRRLFWLVKMKWKGVPIIYRLDGINWLHKKKKVGIKRYLLAELRNYASKFIHAVIADHIVYQSKFVQDLWIRKGWRHRNDTSVIYNGVEIIEYIHHDSVNTSKRLVILEGTIDYSPYAVSMINELAINLPNDIHLEVYGSFENPKNAETIHKRIIYHGVIGREKVMEVLRGSVYLSLDINPACPNTVIEAMRCGAPVIAFETGSLSELVNNGAGELIAYGSNPWMLQYPDVPSLTQRIIPVFDNYARYSNASRERFINKFTLSKMYNNYMNIINNLLQ